MRIPLQVRVSSRDSLYLKVEAIVRVSPFQGIARSIAVTGIQSPDYLTVTISLRLIDGEHRRILRSVSFVPLSFIQFH